METKRHYDNLDGLRAYSAIGIIMMHILANGNYSLGGFVFERLIPSFTDLVFLFMIVSGFSMCCGYYEKISKGTITPTQFYSKRYSKILPYFAALCVLDVIISPKLASVYEAFANLTLCFGLLPNADISVIGVGWFLGVVFVFYLLFPFFCYLLRSKKTAWLAFFAALVFQRLCILYFFDTSHVVDGFSARINIVYCSTFFIAGGLIYLYRDWIFKNLMRFRYVILALCVISAAMYFVVDNVIIVYLLIIMFSLFLIYAIAAKKDIVLSNPITRFLSKISMEIYLAHMVVFRIAEKARLIYLFKSDMLSYIFTTIIVVVGVIVFALILNKGLIIGKESIEKIKAKFI